MFVLAVFMMCCEFKFPASFPDIFLGKQFLITVSASKENTQKPMDHVKILPVPDIYLLQTIINSSRPNLRTYEIFYQTVHQNPEISGMEREPALLVANPLKKLGLEVHTGIGGHGVAGILRNGDGKTILMRAELHALPILEQTTLPYRSNKHMIDRYGKERPVMHACGHDMNMASLLGSQLC